MSSKTITVDKDKCNRDDLCVNICPIILKEKPDGYPAVKSTEADSCMSCGQCVAICPTGALEHSDISLSDCPPIEKKLIINKEQAIQFLRSRRSIRTFKSKPVAQRVIQKLIEIARYAPSGGNEQNVEWTVFNDKSKLEKLTALSMDWLRYEITENARGDVASYAPHHDILNDWDSDSRDGILWNAPAVIIASTPADTHSAMVNIAITLSYLDLSAPVLGLGTCWVGSFTDAINKWEPLKEEINLPRNHTYNYAVVLGYPKYKFLRLIERKEPVIRWQT
ncbi:MAG: nitroreductase family protein [Desulfobacterales bacterium]|nr:nitroreductase family protein [Desulfobacterales bacterium]